MSTQGIRKFACLSAIALVFSASTASAQDRSADEWKWGGEAYFWGASIGGTTTTGANVDIGINKIIDNLKFGAMGALAARKGNWTVFGDLIYLDVGNKATVPVNLGGGVVPVTASLDLKGVISTAGVGYRVYEQSGTSIDLTGGARFLWLDSNVAVTVSPQPTITRTDIGSNWDAVVGFRGKTDLNEKWYLTYYMDVGGGQSNSTWQALGAVNYRFGKADLTFGYRYLDWNLGKFGPFKDLNLSGVFAGVKIPF